MAKKFKAGDRVAVRLMDMPPSLRKSTGLILGEEYNGTVLKRSTDSKDRYLVAIDGVTAPPGWDGGFWFDAHLLKGATDG